jgi:hypothetical protein
MARITIKNLKEVNAKLRALGESVETRHMSFVMLEAARIIYDEALVGIRRLKGHGKDPGNLERNLKLQKGRSSTYASAYVKNKGKHAHLVEFGHVLWTGGRKKHGKGRQRGVVRGYPFFRPAVDGKRREVRKWIVSGIAKLMSGSIHETVEINPVDTGWVG